MAKYFTLIQVNDLVPEIQRRFDLIYEKRSVYLRVHDNVFVQELANDAEKQAGSDLFEGNLEEDIQNLEETIFDLSKEIDSLIELGCVIRSLDQGLIDLPGDYQGERVFFSWKSGEKEIGFFRRRSATGVSAERIPLS